MQANSVKKFRDARYKLRSHNEAMLFRRLLSMLVKDARVSKELHGAAVQNFDIDLART